METISFKTNADSPDAIYNQLKDCLIAEIHTGALKDSCKLPTIRSLADMAGVSLRTMQRAIEGLVADGICFQKSRVGVYINRRALADNRRRIIILQRQEGNGVIDTYFSKRFQLQNDDLYCNVVFEFRSFVYNEDPKRILPPGELNDLRRTQPDCLIVMLPHLSSQEALQIAELPFPVIFLGDLLCGEIHDPRINMIREDTGWRVRDFIQRAGAMGYRDTVCICGNPKAFYVKLLKQTGEAAAAGCGIRFRLIGMAPEAESNLEENFASTIREMLAGGMPDAIFFDGTPQVERAVQLLDAIGYHHPQHYRIFCEKPVNDGIFLIYDTTAFARKSATLIGDAIMRRQASFGIQTLKNTITSQAMIIHNQ